MSFQKAKEYVCSYGYGDRIMEFDVSSATVELAAEAVGCDPDMIAKTLSFDVNGEPILIVVTGSKRIDNPKYKATFNTKAKMLAFDEVEEKIGHKVGGVCPFGINDGIKVYLDNSLKAYDYIYPACGSDNSAVKLTYSELEEMCNGAVWVDVSK